MTADATKTTLEAIAPLRALFLQEDNSQVRYNACHERGWSDSYLLTMDGVAIGYGSIMGQERADRDTVFEFYVLPSSRDNARCLFVKLLATSGAKYIECQSNHPLLCSMLYEFSRSIRADAVLFDDHTVTETMIPGAVVRLRCSDDQIFEHEVEPVGGYVLEIDGEIVATGGFLTHYNEPFADLFMEVRSESRRRGFGSLLVQEVKKACYLSGRVPAARCGIENRASRATLIKAGMKVCGFMLIGPVSDTATDLSSSV